MRMKRTFLNQSIPLIFRRFTKFKKQIFRLHYRKTPSRGILKSRPASPSHEIVMDNKIVEKSKVVADKALNILNPYRYVYVGQSYPFNIPSLLMYLRKYSQRQKDLKKALSWWEDQDENPDISYVDFSRRKLVFDFGSFRRVSDISAR